MRKTAPILLLVIFAIAIIFTACEKENDNDVPDDSSLILTPDKTNVNPYELVTLSVSNLSLTQEEYHGKIGETEVKAVKVEDHKLMMMIPKLDANSYIISLNIEDKIGSVEITIKAQETITDAEVIISPIITKMQNKLDYLETVAIETGNIISQDEKDLLDNFNTEFDEIYAQMSNDDKIQLAHFINVNSAMFTHTNFGDTKGEEDIRAYGEYIAGAMINIMWSGSSLGLMIAAPDPTFITKGIAILAAAFLVAELIELGSRTIALYEITMIESESEIFSANKSDFIFENNSEFVFNVNVKYRTIYNADLGTSNTTLSNIFQNLNRLQYWWGKVDGYIITMKEFFGFEGGGLSGRPKAVSEITTYSTTNETVDAANTSISSNNSNVVATFNNSGQQLKATFSTVQSEEQTFDFTYTYAINDFTYEKVYNAILTVKQPYSIEILSGNNQSGELGELLEEPIEVLVKDEEGNPFENALVTFEVSEGSVSFDQTTTNEDGIAFTYWSLGTNNDEQELIAKAFESDGITVVEGSPVVFSAEELVFDFEGAWLLSYYTMDSDGLEYLHQQERFVCNTDGYASTSEVRHPTNPPPNNDWQPSGPVSISYGNGLIILNEYLDWYLIVNSVDDQIFYSQNWGTTYNIGDYYWKQKLERR